MQIAELPILLHDPSVTKSNIIFETQLCLSILLAYKSTQNDYWILAKESFCFRIFHLYSGVNLYFSTADQIHRKYLKLILKWSCKKHFTPCKLQNCLFCFKILRSPKVIYLKYSYACQYFWHKQKAYKSTQNDYCHPAKDSFLLLLFSISILESIFIFRQLIKSTEKIWNVFKNVVVKNVLVLANYRIAYFASRSFVQQKQHHYLKHSYACQYFGLINPLKMIIAI